MDRTIPQPARHRDAAIRLREFLRVAKGESVHRTTRILHQRPHKPRGTSALQAFLRIDRGHSA